MPATVSQPGHCLIVSRHSFRRVSYDAVVLALDANHSALSLDRMKSRRWRSLKEERRRRSAAPKPPASAMPSAKLVTAVRLNLIMCSARKLPTARSLQSRGRCIARSRAEGRARRPFPIDVRAKYADEYDALSARASSITPAPRPVILICRSPLATPISSQFLLLHRDSGQCMVATTASSFSIRRCAGGFF